MKNMFRLGSVLLALALTACGPKPEEVCDCMRQSANNWMLKGIKPSEAKLLAPCAEMMAKLKEDQAAKVKIEADYEDVRRSLNEKKLLAVGGKTPVFPSLPTTLDSVLAAYKIDYAAAQYRYLNLPVLVSITGLYVEVDSSRAGGLVASCTPLLTSAAGKPEEADTRISIPITPAIKSQLCPPASEMIFDRKRRRSFKQDKRWFTVEFTGGYTY